MLMECLPKAFESAINGPASHMIIDNTAVAAKVNTLGLELKAFMTCTLKDLADKFVEATASGNSTCVICMNPERKVDSFITQCKHGYCRHCVRRVVESGKCYRCRKEGLCERDVFHGFV